MKEEAPGKFLEREGERADAGATIVLVAEGDDSVVDVQEAVIRDCDAVRIAGEILQDVPRILEGWLRVDDPLGPSSVLEVPIKCDRVLIASHVTVEIEGTVAEGIVELSQQPAPEQTAEDADRQKEAGTAGPPGTAIVSQPAGRDHAVDVGMMDKSLTPGVKYGEEAETGAEMLGVGGHILERGCGGPEQEIVDDPGILQGEGCEVSGKCEDDVGVRHRQHFGLARLGPGRLSAALTLRAVAVAARVVGDPPAPAGVAFVDVAAQRGRSARQDGLDDGALLPAPGRRHSLRLEAQVLAEDLGDLVPWPLGHLREVADLGL